MNYVQQGSQLAELAGDGILGLIVIVLASVVVFLYKKSNEERVGMLKDIIKDTRANGDKIEKANLLFDKQIQVSKENNNLSLKNNEAIMLFIKEHCSEVKSDVKEVKSDVKEVKSDVKEVKSDVKEVKSDVKEVKSLMVGGELRKVRNAELDKLYKNKE